MHELRVHCDHEKKHKHAQREAASKICTELRTGETLFRESDQEEEQGKEEECEKKQKKEQTSVRLMPISTGKKEKKKKKANTSKKTIWVGLRVCEGVAIETRLTPAIRVSTSLHVEHRQLHMKFC